MFCLQPHRLTVLLSLILLGAAVAIGAPTGGGILVLYNAGSVELGEDLVKAFKQRYPEVKVEITRAGSGELLTRIQAEAASPRGDVIMALAKENMEILRDLLAPYKVKEDAAFAADLKDAGEHKYYGFSYNIQAFIINTNLVSLEDAPKSWKDLGDKKWSGKIALSNPALSGSGYSQLFQMVDLHGWELVREVSRVATYVPTSTLAYTLVSRGVFAIGASGEANIFVEKNKGLPVEVVYPGDGTGLRFDACGIIKGGPNSSNARLWMDFITTREAMTIVSQAPHYRRMVRPDVPPPPGLKPSGEIKFVPYNDAEAAASRDAYLQRFGAIVATQ